VLGWLDAQGLERVTLLGHSMGGKLAMLLACRHPERVAGLIVVDIAPKDYFWPAHRQEFSAMNELDLVHLTSRAAAEKQFEARVSSWPMRKFLLTNLARDNEGRWRWTVNLPALTAALPTMEANPLGAADRFAGPVLFITGGKSPYVGAGDHAAIRGHFPAARIDILPAAGHNPHIEAREVFVALVNSAQP
jgi:esterase